MPDAPGQTGALRAVPLFPLPNTVLFPHAVLPLHIFEERYKKMTADALAGQRHIAMAMLKPGWEKDYYGRPPIEPVVCVGTILSHERLPDGKYNFLLRGHTRARILREIQSDEPYRAADVEALVETESDERELSEVRRQLAELFEHGACGTAAGRNQIRQMLASPEIPTAVIADLIASMLLRESDVALAQSLLSETSVKRRVEKTLQAVAARDARLN